MKNEENNFQFCISLFLSIAIKGKLAETNSRGVYNQCPSDILSTQRVAGEAGTITTNVDGMSLFKK